MSHGKQWAISAVVGLCLAASPALAMPGDPFGDDDTGCVPADKPGLACGIKLSKALAKLTLGVVKCHLVQADHAFQTGHSSPGFDNAEENCEEGPSNTAAKAKFDNYLENNAGLICAPTVLAAAQARGNALVTGATSLDVLNGSFFCDNTSGLTIAEPGGDDAGSIPATPENFKCSMVVAKLWGKLVQGVYKCHYSAARYGFASKTFDEELCEEGAPKGQLARYNAKVQKYIDAGFCPPCLADSMSATNALALATQVVADLDAKNEEIFPCP